MNYSIFFLFFNYTEYNGIFDFNLNHNTNKKTQVTSHAIIIELKMFLMFPVKDK